MIVVADTGPIHYLVLSGFIGTLHDLYRLGKNNDAVDRKSVV